MNKNKNLLFNILTILALAFIGASLSTKVQKFRISPQNARASYTLNAQQGDIFSIRVKAKKQNHYFIAFYRPQEYYPQYAPSTFSQGNGITDIISEPANVAGAWKVQIIPKYISDVFIVSVSIQIGGKFLGNMVDVIKTKKIIILKYQKGQNCTFSVSGIPQEYLKQTIVDLYQGGPVLDFINTKKIYSNVNEPNNKFIVNCQAETFGYHYLTIQSTLLAMFQMPQITIKYQTNDYICPFDKYLYDLNERFNKCIINPCLELLSIDVCKKCQERFILQDGQCYLNVNCKRGQYFDMEQCKKVEPNCVDFDYVGGKCKKCAQNYELKSFEQKKYCQKKPQVVINLLNKPSLNKIQVPTSQSGSQTILQQQLKKPQNSTPAKPITQIPLSNLSVEPLKTVPQTPATLNTTKQIPNITQITPPSNISAEPLKTVPQSAKPLNTTKQAPISHLTAQPPKNTSISSCQQGKYLFKGQCINNPPNCAQVDPIRRICINCNEKYIFNPQYNRCELPQITCEALFTNIGNRCMPYPPNCKKTTSLNRCTLCNTKYTLIDRQCRQQ